MPPTSESTHLFLSPITHPKDHIWFKSNVNLGESTLRNFVRDMAATVGLKGDYTNKSGRVKGITRMCVARVPLKTIALNTGHKNMKSIERYNWVKALDARVARALARPDSGERVFKKHYEVEVAQWHAANGGVQPQQSIQFSEVSNQGARVDFSFSSLPDCSLRGDPILAIENVGGKSISPSSSSPRPVLIGSTSTEPVSIVPALVSQVNFRASLDVPIQHVSAPLTSDTIPVDLCNTPITSIPTSSPTSTPVDAPMELQNAPVTASPTSSLISNLENPLDCTPSTPLRPLSASTPVQPLPCSTPSSSLPLATPTSLVEEEMRFWSQYNFDDEGDNGSLSVEKITEAPQGTIFAMQKNLALLRRENAILRDSLAALQQQASLQEQVVNQKQAAHQYQAAHQQQVRYHQQSSLVNHESSRNHQPFFQQQQQNQHASNGYRYPYMVSKSRFFINSLLLST